MLDTEGLERLIERVIEGGVHGLFILGSTGEGPHLSYRLRRELITRTCRQAAARVPVLVGITDTAFVEAVELARCAAEAGAQAVVTSAPYYFQLSQPELIQFVQRLTAELPLPLLLYNMPMMTKTQFEPNTVRDLLQLEKVIGIKDSSGNLGYFGRIAKVAKARPDWVVLAGWEHLLARAIKLGGHGGVPGGAQVDPRLLVELYEAAERDDLSRVRPLQKRLLRLGQIYQVGDSSSAFINTLKTALSLLGVCNDRMAEPFSAFGEPQRQRVRAILESAGYLSKA
ncbi:Dihydrodipicolinate synthetase [Verrucomicrobia bacterium]|nr:Dihydrodipicolinate synthetase [Verrucomicrobiota bacterium]